VRQKFIPFLSIVLIALYYACSESPSIFKDQELTLHVDAEVTETWITLSSNPLTGDVTYIVQRDTSVIYEGRLQSADTLLHDTGLEPATAYSYTAWARKGGDSSERSSLTVTTMDTTSHDFIITDYIFGTEDISEFYDVVVVNDNLVIAVGEFFINGERYNMARWDGSDWEFKALIVPYFGFDYDPAFSGIEFKKDIWLSSGATLYRWNETVRSSLLMREYLNSSDYSLLYTFFALTDTSFYFGAKNGNLIYSNSKTYHLIPNNIELPVNDIYGIYNENTQKTDVFATLGNKYQLTEGELLQVTPSSANPVFDWKKALKAYSIWVMSL